MIYCPECGTEVAEIDTFCPNCGISLRPIPVAEKLAEDAFASTIVMPEVAGAKAPVAEPAVAGKPDAANSAREDGPPEVENIVEEKETVEEYSKAPADAKLDEIRHEATAAQSDSSDEKGVAQPLAEMKSEPEEGPGALEHKHIEEDGKAEKVDLESNTEVTELPELPLLLTKGDEADDALESPISEPCISSLAAPSEIISAEETGGVVVEEIILNQGLSDATDSEIEKVGEIHAADAFDLDSPPLAANAPILAADEAVKTGSPENALDERPAENVETPAVDGEHEAVEADAAATGSGDISEEGGKSFTTPNIGAGSTDGRKSGLKPLSEGILLNGRYKILKKIGGGGMGAVYLAADQNLGNTQRAVKEMVQSHIEEEQQAKAIDDFKRESMILSTLDHPSIPTIYDYFYDDVESRFYLVMKYISGGDLASRLRAAPEGRIDERTVTEWALQIIDVLDYLHSLPTTIVYRDLKPSNVMIDGNTGRVMLIDFGIARSINQNREKGVTAVGTMGYAPPELFSGQVEPRSDIYSLGSTMFHLLTGADPQNNPLLIFDFQKNPRPRQINPRLSDQIEKILMRAVEYSAEARFSNAADMKRALQEHLDHLRSGNLTYGISETPAAVSLAFQTVFCGFCGQRIVATDLFCAFCGSKQPLAQHGVHSEIYARGNVTARLVIDGTSELESPAFSLEKSENLVGRRDPMSNIFPEVDLSKYDPQTKISRRHARIWRDGNAYMVEDLGSSNGTLLLTRVSDTMRLAPHQPHPLASGDRLRIGDTTLQFIVG